MSDDTADGTIFAHVQCPDCGEIVPIGLLPGVIEDGNLVIEPDMADVWAHAWTHGVQA